MKIEAEIVNVRTSKKGDTMTVFIPKEHRDLVVKGIMPFLEKPVTIEILVDANKVLENMKQISEDQRKKLYSLFKDFGNEYGDTADNVKELLKQEYCKSTGMNNFSLSDCSTDIAKDFIDWIIEYSRSKGYEFAFREIQSNFGALLARKLCFVCKSSGTVYGNSDGKLCLCDTHKSELTVKGPKEFMKLYHLELA